MDPVRLATCLDRSAAASGAIASTVSSCLPRRKLLSLMKRLALVERPRRRAAHRPERAVEELEPFQDRWASIFGMLAPSAHLTDAAPVFPPKPVTQRFSGAPGLSAGVLGDWRASLRCPVS